MENKKLKLESIAGGPLQINKDGTFDLWRINDILLEKGLQLEIKYRDNEQRYTFGVCKVID